MVPSRSMNIARYIRQQFTSSFAARQTSSTVTAFMHLWSIGHSRRRQGLHSTACLTIRVWGPYGPVAVSSVGPNIATVGIPNAAAQALVPETFLIIHAYS